MPDGALSHSHLRNFETNGEVSPRLMKCLEDLLPGTQKTRTRVRSLRSKWQETVRKFWGLYPLSSYIVSITHARVYMKIAQKPFLFIFHQPYLELMLSFLKTIYSSYPVILHPASPRRMYPVNLAWKFSDIKCLFLIKTP